MSKRVSHNKLKYEDVKTFIGKTGCKLLSKEYVDNKAKLKIECKCGRTFNRDFAKFKNAKRHYCNVCSGKSKYDMMETLDVLKNSCRLIPKNKLKNNTKMRQKFICIDCGSEITASIGTLMKNKIQPCYKCNNDHIEHTYEGVKFYIENNSECKLLSNEYINNSTKLELRCGCGEVFKTSFAKFKSRNKRQCNKCSGSEKRTYQEIKEAIEKNGSKLITSEEEYKHTRQKLKIKCFNCQKEYNMDYISFIGNKYKACQKCAIKLKGKNQRLTQEYVSDFIKSNDCELLSNYEKSNGYIDIKCKCGNVFTTKFNEFNSGHKRRCNECSNVVSNGEKFFSDWLKENNINHITQKKFKDCKYKQALPFDFYIIDKNILIEIDGFLHREYNEYFHKTYESFQKCVERDNIKTKYAKDNDINLYRIKYNKIRDIKDWIEENGKFILR